MTATARRHLRLVDPDEEVIRFDRPARLSEELAWLGDEKWLAVERAASRPDLALCIVATWVAERDQVGEACTVTHDGLLRAVGAKRCTDVAWRIASGPSALERLDELTVGAAPAIADYYARLHGLLTANGGFLVAAMAGARLRGAPE